MRGFILAGQTSTNPLMKHYYYYYYIYKTMLNYFGNWRPSYFGGFGWKLTFVSYQGILKGEVSLYCWPPVWLVWNQLYNNWQFLFLFAKQTNPKPVKHEVNITVILPPLVFPGHTIKTANKKMPKFWPKKWLMFQHKSNKRLRNFWERIIKHILIIIDIVLIQLDSIMPQGVYSKTFYGRN